MKLAHRFRYGKSILTPRVKEWWSETTEPMKSMSLPRPNIRLRCQKKGWRRGKRNSSVKGLLSTKFKGKSYYDWIQPPDPKALRLPIEILEQIFLYAAGDRQSARSLMGTCKFLNAFIAPIFYRTVILLDRRALHSFAQAVEYNRSITDYTQHLWIGTKSLDQALFFPPEDRKDRRVGKEKPKKYWPAKADIVKEVIDDSEKVLLACHKLRSLAIPEEFFTPQKRRAEFKFRLEEYISTSDQGDRGLATFESMQSIRRVYILSNGYINRRVGEGIYRLPSVETLEVLWLRGPLGIFSIGDLLSWALAPNSPVRSVTFTASKTIMDDMYPMARNITDDRRVIRRDLSPAVRPSRGTFAMEEWEARTARDELWE